MRPIFLICLFLNSHLFAISHAATIPEGNSLSNNYPFVNWTSIHETLRALHRYEVSPDPLINDTAFHTTQRWPPPPFDFHSQTTPPWTLHVRSYDRPRLTFRQMHAAISLCVNAMEIIKLVDPSTLMRGKTYHWWPTVREPYDLSQEDVEVAFYNSADEHGMRYTAEDMFIALDVLLHEVLPRDLPEMMSTVAHYAEMEPRHGAFLRYKKMKIQRNTNLRGRVAATT
ncbi:MAG: hypothetical protein L6R39_000396 [Caloplaca ligustica]|nr:MAG: hypothetical protein L6R39_000396 [Caloplaca ligustica]